MTATECTSRKGIALALGAVLVAALSVLAMMPAAEHPVTIEFLPTDVTAPPSADGIEAVVKE